MDNDSLHIAFFQTDLIWENRDENLKKFEGLFAELPSVVDLIVLPEMFSTGFSMNVKELSEPMDGETICWMQEQAEKQDAVISGSLMIKDDGKYFNRFVFVRPGGKIEFYDKRHLFSMGEENIHFLPGKVRKIFNLKDFRILPQICYDLRFPVFIRNRNDYDLIINVANWPAPRKNAWQVLLKARAIENQAYVVGVNRVGADANGIRYSGDSAVIDPKGKEMVVGKIKTEEVLVAKLSKSSLERFRSNFPAWQDQDDFQLGK